MTLEEKIAEKKNDIETIDFIAARCTTDGQARAYDENRRARVAELVELEAAAARRSGIDSRFRAAADAMSELFNTDQISDQDKLGCLHRLERMAHEYSSILRGV